MHSDHLHREHCKYFPLKIWVNTSLFNFLAYIFMLWKERLWMTVYEKERGWGWGGGGWNRHKMKYRRVKKKKARVSRAGDRLSGREERCGSMWGMSVTLMNYLRLEIPQPSRGLSAALWYGGGVGWIRGGHHIPDCTPAIYHQIHSVVQQMGDWWVATVQDPFRKQYVTLQGVCMWEQGGHTSRAF